MKICPYCNHENSNKEKWCIFCGRPVQDLHPLDTKHNENGKYQHQPEPVMHGLGDLGKPR